MAEKVPAEYHSILREHMGRYRGTIVKNILSKTSVKTVIIEIQKITRAMNRMSTMPDSTVDPAAREQLHQMQRAESQRSFQLMMLHTAHHAVHRRRAILTPNGCRQAPY